VEIPVSAVKELRERTGAGMMDCKRALIETNGDLEKAIEYLREKGLSSAAKKAGRIAAEGIVDSYIHMGGRIGVLMEVNCETDFAAKGDQFKELVKDLTMQVAAARPEYVRREEVPVDVVEKEKAIYTAQAVNEGKPQAIAEKITVGRLEKFYKEVCLMEQPFIKDTDKTVEQVVKEAISKIGENISVRRFVRYERGEGLQKRSDDFASEVMSEMNKC
jgi:elongation factor Ts